MIGLTQRKSLPFRNDTPSFLQFSNLSFLDWTGSSLSARSKSRSPSRRSISKGVKLTRRMQVVDIECSANAPCPNMVFHNIDVSPPAGQALSFVCRNVISERGLPGRLPPLPCDTSVPIRRTHNSTSRTLQRNGGGRGALNRDRPI